jgi:ubiquitin carboxyl-terminal hydrolase 25
LQLPELPYDSDPGCQSHTMLLVPDQTYEDAAQSFLSILCAECRYHFHVKTYKKSMRPLDKATHPSHMLIPVPTDTHDHDHRVGRAEFICAGEDCFYLVDISVNQPILTADQVRMLQDNNRILLNLKRARDEDFQRYADIPDSWGASSTVPTLAKYIEDRLFKPIDEVLKIKKRNKRFCIAFGNDFDDLLRSLGFDEKVDEEGEECWYITAPEPVSIGQPSQVNTRRAHLQDTLEELRTLTLNLNTIPAWSKLMEAFPGYSPRHEDDATPSHKVSSNDALLLGCLIEFSPTWFSWAAILLASLCPSRRDMFLDAGLRCIQERSEEASLSIIMYKSQFDQSSSFGPRVQEAFDFFGIRPEDRPDIDYVLSTYRHVIAENASDFYKAKASTHLDTVIKHLSPDTQEDSAAVTSQGPALHKRRMSIRSATRLLNVDASFSAEIIREFASNLVCTTSPHTPHLSY